MLNETLKMSKDILKDFPYIMALYSETVKKLAELKVGDPARLIYEMRYQILGFDTISKIIEERYSNDKRGEQ